MKTPFCQADLQGLSISVELPDGVAGFPAADEVESIHEVRLGQKIFELMLVGDPDAYGFLRTEGQTGALVEGGRFAPMAENLGVIARWYETVFPAGGRQDGTLIINGIGGQTTCSEWFLGAVPMPKGREYLCLDSLGTRTREALLESLVAKLSRNAAGKAVGDLHEIDYPLVWLSSSKSGATDETMVNFQATFKLLVRAFARVIGRPAEFEEKLIRAIFSPERPKPVWTVRLEDALRPFAAEEDRQAAVGVLKKVFNTMIFTTDHNPGKYNGSASRLTAFARGPLAEGLTAAGARALPSMHIPRDLGGRYNGIGANALVIAAFLGLSAGKIAEAARGCLSTLRSPDPVRNPLMAASYALALAGRLMKNGNKALVVVNSPGLVKSAEALVQLFPETIGKGRGAKPPMCFGLFPVARLGCCAMEGLKQKIIFDIHTECGQGGVKAPRIEIGAGQDLVVRLGLRDTGEENIARLIMALEFLAMGTSVFNEAHYLAAHRPQTDPVDTAAVRALLSGASAPDWQHTPDHLAFSGALQGGVQLAKKLAQQAGMALFKDPKTSVLADDKTVLPARDAALRRAWYDGRRGLKFVSGEINAPGFEEIWSRLKESEAAKTSGLAGEELEAALGLCALKMFAARSGRLIDVWAYAPRSAALGELKHFAEESFADILDPAPQTQHQRAQQKVEGADATLTLILDVAKAPETVEKSEELLNYDGCVPAYLHGFYPSEVGALYAEQYSRLLLGMEGCFSARLLAPDIEVKENLERLKKVIGAAEKIFRKAGRAA